MTNTTKVRPIIGWLVAIVIAFVMSYVAFTFIKNNNQHPLTPKAKMVQELASLPVPQGSAKVGDGILVDRLTFYTLTQKFVTNQSRMSLQNAYAEIFKSHGWRSIPSGVGDDELRYCKNESILGSIVFPGDSGSNISEYKIIITVGGSAIVSCS